ncbi:hypothetical protein D3C77_501570 [compost metagenome]
MTFDGSANQENARIFPVLSLSLKTLPAQDSENFISVPERTYVGESIPLRFMRLYVTGAPGGYSFSAYWPSLNSNYVSSGWLNGLAILNLELTHVATAVHFQFTGSATITVRNRSNKIIYTRQHFYVGGDGFQPTSIAIPGEKIKTIEVTAVNDSYRAGGIAQFRVTY